MDGATSSHSGLELVVYMLKGPERVTMLKSSAIGTLALFITPLAALLMAGAVAWLTYKRQDATVYGAATALLPLVVVFASAGVTSTGHLIGGGMVAPQAGSMLLFITQTGLIAHSLLGSRAETKQDTEADPEQRPEPRRRRKARSQPAAVEPQPYQHGGQQGQYYEDLPDGDPQPDDEPDADRRPETRAAETTRRSDNRPRRVVLTPDEQQRGQAAKEGSRRRRIR